MNANYLKVTLEISRNGVLGDWLVHLENLSFMPVFYSIEQQSNTHQAKAAQMIIVYSFIAGPFYKRILMYIQLAIVKFRKLSHCTV